MHFCFSMLLLSQNAFVGWNRVPYTLPKQGCSWIRKFQLAVLLQPEQPPAKVCSTLLFASLIAASSLATSLDMPQLLLPNPITFPHSRLAPKFGSASAKACRNRSCWASTTWCNASLPKFPHGWLWFFGSMVSNYLPTEHHPIARKLDKLRTKIVPVSSNNIQKTGHGLCCTHRVVELPIKRYRSCI